MENKLQIEGVEFIDILVTFEVPTDRSLYDFGAVTLAKDGRNFILDPIISSTNDDATEITEAAHENDRRPSKRNRVNGEGEQTINNV
jgi:hypothetical protein